MKTKSNFFIPVKYNTKNKFCVATVHYSADPEKDEEWKKEAKKGMSDDQWEREYEISYELYAGKPVYPQFTKDHIQKFEWVNRGNSYVLRGWDFGFHKPAVIFSFFNKWDQLCFRHEMMGHDEIIKEFAKRVINFSRAEFQGAKFLDFGDPAGNQANSQTKESDVEVLRGLGINLISKQSEINEGLEIMRQRMLRRNDGRLGLLVHPDCQIFIDGLKGGYRYPETKRGKAEDERPLKDGFYDHCFIAGTKIKTDRGDVNIENLSFKHKILTRRGFRKPIKKWERSRQIVKDVIFSDGTILTGTLEHPIWVKNKGWVVLDDLRYGDIIETCSKKQKSQIKLSRLKWAVSNLPVIPKVKKGQKEFITFVQQRIKRLARDCGFMSICGLKKMVKYPMRCASIIKMVIRSIMRFLISSLSLNQSTPLCMANNALKTQWNTKNTANTLKKSDQRLRSGMLQKRAENGTLNTQEKHGRISRLIKRNVSSVVMNIKLTTLNILNIVLINVKQSIGMVKKKILKNGIAQFVVKSLKLISILEKRLVDQKNVSVVRLANPRKATVYNLTVSQVPEYYANGILVHNCQDAARYIAINNLEVANTTGGTRQSSRENKIMKASKSSISDYF